jgi:pimeloyl-ACP methyl ester carboxylesterase
MVPAVANEIEETTVTVDGLRTFLRSVPGDGPPAVFVHGNPTHSEDWLPFLSRIEGPAIAPDLPGWGRSERPREFDYSMNGLAGFLERLLAELGIGEHTLVVHDWGVVALIAAQRHPQRVARLVVTNAVPLTDDYRWHWAARIWRTPVAGELFNLAATRRGLALGLRQARGDGAPMPAEFVEMIWRGYRRGFARPVLELYRSADPAALAAAGEQLEQLHCPALVLWGERDPYLPSRFGREYTERLPGGEYLGVDAGHWPWVERPELVDRILTFIISGRVRPETA